MSNAKQELTPEEKLLALIQRDKSQETPPVVAVAPVSPSPAPVAVASPAAPAVVESPSPVVPKAEPASEKKLKLSAQVEKPQVKAPEKAEPVAPSKIAEEKTMPAAAAKAVASSGPDKQVEPAPVPSPPKETPVVVTQAQPIVMTVRRGVIGLPLINRVLALVVLVLLVCVVYSVASIRADVAKEVSAQVANAGSLTLAPPMMTSESAPALDFFLDKVKRNLFLPIGSPVSTNGVGPVVVGKAGDLKLVGISMDDAAPEESLAIIRNKVDSKTYFVKAGEGVGDTGLTLARVLPDRVILKSHKQEVELK